MSDARHAALLLEFTDLPATFTGPRRFWSGAGTIVFESEDWTGNLGILDVSMIEKSAGPTNRRATVTIPLTDPAQRARLLRDWGAFGIELGWISSTDAGATWARVPLRFRGRLSQPVVREGAMTVPIETHVGDVDRGRPLYWSHDAQQARSSGDRFFEYAAALERGKEIRWPP